MADQATVSVASNDNQTDNPKGTKVISWLLYKYIYLYVCNIHVYISYLTSFCTICCEVFQHKPGLILLLQGDKCTSDIQ